MRRPFPVISLIGVCGLLLYGLLTTAAQEGTPPAAQTAACASPASADDHSGTPAAAMAGTPDAGTACAPNGAATPVVPDSGLLWPAPDDPLARTVLAGLEPQPKEHLDYHVHAHLDIFVDGQAIVVPAGIGINIDDPGVRQFDTPSGVAYGGIDLCEQACISPLHTHDADGVLHTESAIVQPNTLGQFFVEWGVRLDADCVGEFCRPGKAISVYVDGEAFEGNPADIELTDLKVIVIVIGSPPEVIPSDYDFSNA
jgi:hypothetical protein